MFARLLGEMKEPFYDTSMYPKDSTPTGVTNMDSIKSYFEHSLPNPVLNSNKKIDIETLTKGIKSRTNTIRPILKNKQNLNAEYHGSAVAAKQASCEAVGNGDQFDHLSSLARSQDPNEKLRCGWVYNSSNPANGRGALGISSGPHRTTAAGQWMWNLNAAKEKYHTAICQSIQGCADIDAAQYKQRCGWCTKSGKAVPVVGGAIAYPYGKATACNPTTLVTKAAQCPPPTPITEPFYVRSPAEACTPLENGALPRDCLMQKVVAAGCSDAGTIYQALKSGSNNDYMNILTKEQAFKVYQERASIGMNVTGLRTGKITVSDALNDFKRVQDQSASEANTGLSAASRDLCLNKGAINQFDFCTELQDSTKAPFTADCVMKAIWQAGGNIVGQKSLDTILLPMTKDSLVMKNWNDLGTWGAVKAKINQIQSLTRSSDRKTQEQAMLDFYGIKLQNKRNPIPYGPEIAYKGTEVLISCQRPVPVPHGYTARPCISDEENDMVDTAADRLGFTMGTPPSLRPVCNAPFGNPQENVSGWQYKGCYRDCSQGRGLPNYIGQVTSVEQCIAKAKSLGYNTSGNQYFGECWAGNNTDWGKMGNAGCCEPIGGGCTQQIYSSK